MEHEKTKLGTLLDEYVDAFYDDFRKQNLSKDAAMACADIVKDLSEAEKERAWAEYYISVRKAMDENPLKGLDMVERFGYIPTPDRFDARMPYTDMHGWDQRHIVGGEGYRQGYRMGYYDPDANLHEAIATVKRMWADADETLKEKLRKEVKALAEQMNV
jgi:hypothetical protein